MNRSIIELKNVGFAYDSDTPILKNLSYKFESGKTYAILGPSGSGKTTLLSLLGGLDIPQEGEILLDGRSVSERGLAFYRKECVSFVFQSYNLIEYLTPIENVQLTANKLPVLPVLEKVGLDKEMCSRSVLKLSGGQQQRVAIARALASNSSVLLADEPTGNLDEDTAKGITRLLNESAHSGTGKCVIIVTHSNALANAVDVRLKLHYGVLTAIA